MEAVRSKPAGLKWLANGWLLAAGGLIGAILWSFVCTAPGIPWNAARLAPSFALARGLPIYALRDSGAHLGWVYGPVFPLWYAPVGFTDQPTLGLMLATGWNALTILAPLYAIVRLATAGSAPTRRFLFALGAVLLLVNPISRLAFLFMHVDAVSVGWAVVACLALHAAAVRGWRYGLPLAALAVALSVAAKQVSIVLLPATFLWLWREGHSRLIGRWIFWLALGCGGLAALFFMVFGAEGMLFNAWLLFSRMPWQGGWNVVARNLGAVAASSWLWILAALLGGLAVRLRWRERISPEAASLVRLLLWLAFWQLPLGVTASLVVDAALNSIHAIHYLFLAGLVVAGSVLARERANAASTGLLRPWFAAGLVAAVGLCALVPVLRNPDVVWRPYRGQDEMLQLARQHPGKIYLPWNPLITLISERKIYPFDEALRYLWMARLEPPRAVIQAAVPAGAMIIYSEPSQSHFALNYFGKDQRTPAVDR